MNLPGYSDVFFLVLDRDQDEDIQTGHVVRTGPNFHPHFEVIAVHGDKVWLRNVATGDDSLARLSRCRRLPAPALAVAAQ